MSIIADVGIDHRDLLRHAGLPLDLLTQGGVALTVDEYFRLVLALEAIANDPLLAVHLTEAISPETFSPVLFAALCSTNLSAAIQRVIEFKVILGPETVSLTESSGASTLRFDWSGFGRPPDLLLHTELLFWIRLARLGTRRRIAPVHIQGPAFPRPDEFETYIGCRPDISHDSTITFSRHDLETPFLTSNDELWAYFEPGLRQRLDQARRTSSHADRATANIRELLPTGHVSVQAVSSQMGLSPRTLQRRLADEGTTFSQVLAETRKSLALYYLDDPNLSLREIALLLGFNQLGSFDRSFVEWTGQTPSAHRRGAQLQR